MKRIQILLVFIFFGITVVIAQKRAITQEGKIVVLYENGTWKYLDITEQKEKNATVQISETQKNTVEIISKTAILQSIPKNYTSESIEFLYDESPTLRRFFSENNKVLAKAKLVIENQNATLHTEWKVNVGDAIRYFGYFSPKQHIELNFEGGEKLILHNREKIYPNGSKKYPISTYQITYELDENALLVLSQHPIVSATMVWQKKTETYDSSNSQALMRLFLFSE